MDSGSPTTLNFCEECGSLRLRDVKDQLQKLFTKLSTTSCTPNVCGICQKSVNSQNKTSAIQGQYEAEDTVAKELVIPQQTTESIEVGKVKCVNRKVKTAKIVNTIKQEISETDVAGKSNQTSGRKVTRLSTGALPAKKYTSSNLVTEEDDAAESDGSCYVDDSDYMDEDVTTKKLMSGPEQGKLVDDPSVNTNINKPVCVTVGVDPELLKLLKPTDDSMRPFKCTFCDVLPFTKLNAFQKHVRSHTGKAPMNKPYKCDVCAKNFKRQVLLFQHQVMHTGLKCSENGCEFKFTNKNDLKCHLLVHSGVMPFQCETCGLGFKLIPSLNVHQTIHSDSRPFSCKYCDKTFSHSRYYKNHLKTHVNMDKYKCDSCVFTCQKESTLLEHKRTHENKGAFKCERCQHVFTYKTLLARHSKMNRCELPKPIKTKTSIQSSTVPEADIDLSYITKWLDPRVIAMMDKPTSIDFPFKCKYCKLLGWQKPNSFLKHMREVHPQEPEVTKPFLCNVCSKSFYTQRDLKVHYPNHTGERPFHCDHAGCNKKFISKEYLKSHQCYVHNTRKHMCSSCGKQFVTNSKLKVHESCVHLKLRPYPCTLCDHASSTKYKRNLHLKRVHGTEKPYICEVCGKKFAVKDNLNVHARIHSRDKPYACEYCDYRCARADYLTAHRRNHTGEKPHQCKFCGRKFSHRTQLVTHQKKHSASDVEMFIPSQKPDEVLTTNEVVVTTCSVLQSSNDEIHNATHDIAVDMMNFVHYTA